jgi:Collagen triple helix repeat (20 copies)
MFGRAGVRRWEGNYMKNRLPTVLAVTALVVALMGATGAAQAVVASFAANAGKLSGFKASKRSKKNTVVVRGANGKIDAGSIPAQARGARGLPGAPGAPGAQGIQGIQGTQGVKGDKGDTGDTGPPGAPNPNADKLDGYDADGLVRVARANAAGAPLAVVDTVLVTVALTAPAAGFVLLQADYNVIGSGCPCEASFVLKDAVNSALSPNYRIVQKAVDGGFASGSVGWLFPVTAGNRSFQLLGHRGLGTIVGVDGPTIQALYVPFGSTGAGTLSVEQTADLRNQSPTATD